MEHKTERLILREFAEDDKYNLFKLFKEDFVSEYEAHLRMKDISDVENYIKFHLENAKDLNRTHFYYVIESRETRAFFGIIGYSFVENTVTDGVLGFVMELEYYLLEEHQNKGYMSEALKKVISLAFESKNIIKIFAQCHKENRKSENVMVKCGMKKSEIPPKPKLYNGVLKENVRYELTAGSYVRV